MKLAGIPHEIEINPILCPGKVQKISFGTTIATDELTAKVDEPSSFGVSEVANLAADVYKIDRRPE